MSRQYAHPLAAMNCDVWLRLLCDGGGVDERHLARAIGISITGLLGVPLKVVERVRFGRRIAAATTAPPLFIIGHWRSGTTHLHNLISRDPAFGCVSYLHCGASGIFLGHRAYARKLMEGALAPTRPMDSMRLGVDEPAEEDLAMARLSTISSYNCFFFPRQARQWFRRCVLFDSARPGDLQQWKDRYTGFLRKVTIDQGGRPLVLKNPANTARIRHLLELFPQARFIHIYRNPYVVYPSTRHLWSRLLPLWALQNWDAEEVDRGILEFYRQLMSRYFEDQHLIPQGRLAEVRYEDLEAHPLDQLRRLYDELHLGSFDRARAHIEPYLASLAGYRKNAYTYETDMARHVYRHWAFTIDRWGYQPPGR